jgi:glutamine amidotransferase
MNKHTVVLVDAGTGNLHSVKNALQKAGAEVILTNDPKIIQKGGRVVLPGVGAFEKFMSGLNEGYLIEPLKEIILRGFPVLGICVGMQAFFQVSQEMGEHAGLGILEGSVDRFPNKAGYKIPHTGWNQILEKKHSPILKKIHPGAYAYFNHSYYCQPTNGRDIIAQTEYMLPFASIVQKENVVGVQFHPEKSQRIGLQLLSNFLSM